MGNFSQTASVKFIFAIYKLLPGAVVRSFWAHDQLFYADVELTTAPPPDICSYLETEMASLADPQVKEMMATNAAELLRHQEQPLLADELALQGGAIIAMAELEGRYVPSPVETFEAGKAKLLEFHTEDGVTRFTGLTAADAKSLKKSVRRRSEGKQHDHLMVGQELGLFFPSPDTVGSYILTPRGAVVLEELKRFWEKLHEGETVESPRVVTSDFKKKVGGGYVSLSQGAALLDDPAPIHALVFQQLGLSLDQLPLTLAELIPAHGPPKGSYHGLLDSCWSTTDATDIFIPPHTALEVLTSSLRFIEKTFMMFDFEIQWNLTTECQQFSGTQPSWRQGVQVLKDALQAADIKWEARSDSCDVNGPAAYVTIPDAVGQKWTAGVIALNLITPEKLKLVVRGTDGSTHTPTMIRRSLFLSFERIIALLVENTAGQLPQWLAPEQVRVLPIGEKHRARAHEIHRRLREAGIRTTLDESGEPLGTRIHAAEKVKVPWMIVLGDQECASDSLAYRRCGDPEPRTGVKLETLINEIEAETKIQYWNK